MKTFALFCCCTVVALAQRSLPPVDPAWGLKPAKPPAYTKPHRPHVKLADLRARYANQKDWTEVVVDDAYLHAAYIQAAPGSRLARRFRPETREWWVVLDGEIRFPIEGHEPFVATKGSMVQVPLQTVYELEVIGSKPALRLEVNIAGARLLYPRETKPEPVAGMEWIR